MNVLEVDEEVDEEVDDMNTAALKFENSDLASRTIAKGFRLRVEQLIERGCIVELNLSEVQSISDSYADELFGILAANFGIEVFADSVKLVGAEDHLYKRIARNIHNRLHQRAAA